MWIVTFSFPVGHQTVDNCVSFLPWIDYGCWVRVFCRLRTSNLRFSPKVFLYSNSRSVFGVRMKRDCECWIVIRSRVGSRNCKKLTQSYDADFSLNKVQFNRTSFLVVCLLLRRQIKTRSRHFWKWNHHVNKFTLVAYIRFKGTKASSRPSPIFFFQWFSSLPRSNLDSYYGGEKTTRNSIKIRASSNPLSTKMVLFRKFEWNVNNSIRYNLLFLALCLLDLKIFPYRNLVWSLNLEIFSIYRQL